MAATIPILTAAAAVVSRARRWPEDNRIKDSLDRMDAHLAVVKRLETIGEVSWAEESRKAAWMFPLRRLARYEVNRMNFGRFVVACIGWFAYAIAVGLLIVRRVFERQLTSATGDTLYYAGSYYAASFAILVSLGIALWWLVTMLRFETAVSRRATAKYRRHVVAGRVHRVVATTRGDERDADGSGG